MIPSTVGGGGGTATADNEHGSTTALAPAAVATLVSFTSGNRMLRGFKAFGSVNFTIWVEVDGVPLPGIIEAGSIVKPAYLVLPNPEPYASVVSSVELKVRNEDTRIGDIEAVLFGE